ncbi:LacI family DNA-binding transcriptional regulator [Arthrobacter sp. ISL-85]|uniref:LacI family DNA-binding transcriptional regulator n=1 Tax=Arthrobacter sp. ISL-85 TaxID=2819115 RepID=UPI001BE7E37C|nr:LacI family DNA-binding transcriptional regulator [Arthrobacter sp. ISL-85]MBT2566276.1 LacI family DNA-binding transcriptional regulator [Arthrobacter sp. ISL-85]
MSVPVTIRDVARAANVSAATVSRTFVRPEIVDASTRERVLGAAARLDYRPNRAAQTLITGLTGNIGIVVPDLTNPFFPSVVRGVQNQAAELGYPALLVDTGEDADRESELVTRLARQVDGLVLCAARMSDQDLIAHQRQCPIVLINRQVPGLPAVTFDNEGGVRQEVTHLKALGHQRIGYVAGPGTSYSSRVRQRAVTAHLATAGLTEVPVGSFAPSFEGGRSAAEKVLLADITAVMVYNDVMALGLINQLAQYGISVPNDLTVIGFDDIEFASMSNPALTTVRIPREQAGAQAMSYLHALMTTTGSVPEPPAQLRTELIFRGTSVRAPLNQRSAE